MSLLHPSSYNASVHTDTQYTAAFRISYDIKVRKNTHLQAIAFEQRRFASDCIHVSFDSLGFIPFAATRVWSRRIVSRWYRFLVHGRISRICRVCLIVRSHFTENNGNKTLRRQ